jgi:hypothetical protein
MWVKRGNLSLGSQATLFHSYGSGNQRTELTFETDNKLRFAQGTSSDNGVITTDQVFRDTAAWYHIVLVADFSNGAASSRAKIYVNGSLADTTINTAFTDADGQMPAASVPIEMGGRGVNNRPFDGYLSEVHFIDGTALDHTSFGETGDYGEWKAKKVSGLTYGTNGFYLPFNNDYTVEGFSTVTYKGNSSNRYLGGFGFQPDLIWQKTRDYGYGHQIVDSVRGTSKEFYEISSASSGVEDNSTTGLTGFKPDGVTLGTGNGWNNSTRTQVIWAWDMGGSNATNTEGSITSTVRANATYGQSIVSYTGNSTNGATVGHGLSSAPEMVIVKARGSATNWAVYFHTLADTQAIRLNDRIAATTENWFNDTDPTSTVVELRGSGTVNSGNMIMYCWHSVSGYSKFGSYTGNGSTTGPVITTGFKPAFLLVKASNASEHWFIFDTTRDTGNPVDKFLVPSSSGTEGTGYKFDFTDTGFQPVSTLTEINGSGTTYIYMAFADKREAAFWLDQSGKNNDWTGNNLTESDISLDSPTNNFATWNSAINPGSSYFQEGNTLASGTGDFGASSTFAQSSGKWYMEMYVIKTVDANDIVIIDAESFHYNYTSDGYGSSDYHVRYYGAGSGYIESNGTTTQSGVTPWDNGEILGIALDLDSSTVQFYLNGSAEGTAETLNSNASGTWAIHAGGNASTSIICNFGQDSSFAGNKASQGKQDSNDIGDFFYEPPNLFKALCTKNLPDPAVIPSAHFNVATWAGTSATKSISSLSFQPDFVWIKARSGDSQDHLLVDSVRGTYTSSGGNTFYSEQYLPEIWEQNHYDSNYGAVSSLNSDGFSLGTDSGWSFVNETGRTYVAWSWKCPTSFSGTTAQGFTYTGKSNADAGISIVTVEDNYDSGTQSLPHNLSKAPEIMIRKNIDESVNNWDTAVASVGTGYYMRINSTIPATSDGWYTYAADSTYIKINDGQNTGDSTGLGFIYYCFHSVDGYSKCGSSYVGNGSSDGSFVFCGFSPTFVMIKTTGLAGDPQGWVMFDSAREPYNMKNSKLYANGATAESENAVGVDFLSNGFKPRHADNMLNGNGQNYIYLAFAESPFKHTNAR